MRRWVIVCAILRWEGRRRIARARSSPGRWLLLLLLRVVRLPFWTCMLLLLLLLQLRLRLRQGGIMLNGCWTGWVMPISILLLWLMLRRRRLVR